MPQKAARVAFDWAPKGDFAAYLTADANSQALVGDLTFLNIFPFFDQYQRSATIWSPDSRYLVVSAIANESTQGLFIVPASGDFEPRFLTEGRLGFWSWD